MPVKSTRPTFFTIVVYRSDVLILVAHYNITVLVLKFLVQTFSFLRADGVICPKINQLSGDLIEKQSI